MWFLSLLEVLPPRNVSFILVDSSFALLGLHPHPTACPWRIVICSLCNVSMKNNEKKNPTNIPLFPPLWRNDYESVAGETHGKSWITIFLLNLHWNKNAKDVFGAHSERKTKIVPAVLREPSSFFIPVGLCGGNDLLIDFYMYLRALEISKGSLSWKHSWFILVHYQWLMRVSPPRCHLVLKCT